MLGNEKALYLLFLIPAVLLPLLLWSFSRKKKTLRTFAQLQLLTTINSSVSLSAQIFKAIMLIIVFVFIVIALTAPAWNPKRIEMKSQGRDVAILLDVSKSMLAQDIKPSRLGRAKLAISDLVNVLDGDRIALMTFAGSTTIKCPLTQDYSFIRMVLDKGITTKSTPVGGTNLGDAIRQATKQIFNSSAGKHMDLIIITDGEENEDNFPLEAAAAANEKGIRIIAIGLGDKENGARIPIYNGSKKTFVTYQGREVWTKLNTDILTKIAAATTDGQCLTVQPGYTFELDEIYKDLIFSAQKKQLESASSIRYQQKFQIFAAIALIILIGEIFVSQRKRQQNEN